LINAAGEAEVSWTLAPGYLIGTEMVFNKNKNGVDTTVFIPPTEKETVL